MKFRIPTSENEKQHIVREGCESIYKDYCAGEPIYISLAQFYPNFEQWIKLNLSKDQAKTIHNKAKRDYNLIKQTNYSAAIGERKDFNFFLQMRFVKKVFEIHKEQNKSILTAYKIK